MEIKEIEVNGKVYTFKDEVARLDINLINESVTTLLNEAITTIDSPADYEAVLELTGSRGYVLWPAPFKLIIYIDYWQEEDPQVSETGVYCYHPEERYLYYSGTLNRTPGEEIIWLDAELMPDILYIYNNEGYKLSRNGYYLEKILDGNSGTRGKIYTIVDDDMYSPIDYSKVNPGLYVMIQDTVAKYLGEGRLDTNIEDDTLFIYKNVIYQSFDNGYIGEIFWPTYEIRDGSVTNSKIANKNVTGNKIADKAITSDKIADSTIEGDNIRHATITGEHIASGTIDGLNIGTGVITGSNIADQTITRDKLVNGTITGDKIARESLGYEHIMEGGITGYNIAEETIEERHLSSGCVGSDALGNKVIFSSHIDDDGVHTNNISDNAIISSKISNKLILSRHLSNNCIGSEHIINNSITGNKLANNTITSDKLADASITGEKIEDQSINGYKIINGEITEEKIANDAITTNKIKNGAVTTNKIQNNSITYDKIALNSIDASKIMDGEIYGSKLEDGGITSEKIMDGAVTDLKLASKFVKKIKINNGSTEYTPDSNGIVDISIATGGGGSGVDQEALDALSSRISSLEPRTTALESNLQTQLTAVTGVTSRVTALESSTNLFGADITSLGDDISSIEDDIDAVETSISTLTAVTNGLRNEIDAMGGNDYSEFEAIGTDATIGSNTFVAEHKYRILSTLTLSDDYAFPKDVTLLFDGGKIVGNYTLTGNNTKIIDTTEQIFGENVSCDGTWDIPFSRPEWFGARADGVDYGSWPLRVYLTVINSNNFDSGSNLIEDGMMPQSNQDGTAVCPKDLDVYFNLPAYSYILSLNLGIVPEYTAFSKVYYDSAKQCFLFSPNERDYYSIWEGSDEYNTYDSNNENPKARTDRVYITPAEIGNPSRLFSSTGNTAAHILESVNGVLTLKFIDEATTNDCSNSFLKAITMREGNVHLQKDGVYTFKTKLRVRDNYAYIPLNGISYNGVFEGNNATLFFLPLNSICTGIWINNLPIDGIEYKIQNLKCTTVKGFKTKDSPSYSHLDYTSSYITAFWIDRGYYQIIDNIYCLNMSTDFEIRWPSPFPDAGKRITIKNWKSRNASQAIYMGTGTTQIIVDGADILTRKYGLYGHHVFYLMFSSATKKVSFIIKNSKIHVPDGFMDELIDARGANPTLAKGITPLNLNPLRLGYLCEIRDCDIIGPLIGSVMPGINYILDNVRFFKNSDIIMNNTLTGVREVTPYVIRKGTPGPAHIKLTNCTFDCDNYGLIINKVDDSWLQDSLVMENCSVKCLTFGKDLYDLIDINPNNREWIYKKRTENGLPVTDDFRSELGMKNVKGNTGVVNVLGSVEIKGCTFESPYSPVITLGALAAKYHCVKFIIENNVAVCSGYFLYVFHPNTTVGSSLTGNIVSIDKDFIGRGGNLSSNFMAALITAYKENSYSDLLNVSIGYNSMFSLSNRPIPVLILSDTSNSSRVRETAITNFIENSNYNMYFGNTIDQVSVDPEVQLL